MPRWRPTHSARPDSRERRCPNELVPGCSPTVTARVVEEPRPEAGNTARDLAAEEAAGPTLRPLATPRSRKAPRALEWLATTTSPFLGYRRYETAHRAAGDEGTSRGSPKLSQVLGLGLGCAARGQKTCSTRDVRPGVTERGRGVPSDGGRRAVLVQARPSSARSGLYPACTRPPFSVKIFSPDERVARVRVDR